MFRASCAVSLSPSLMCRVSCIWLIRELEVADAHEVARLRAVASEGPGYAEFLEAALRPCERGRIGEIRQRHSTASLTTLNLEDPVCEAQHGDAGRFGAVHDVLGGRFVGLPGFGDHVTQAAEDRGHAMPRHGAEPGPVPGEMGDIGLGADDQPPARRQRGVMTLEFAEQHINLFTGITIGDLRQVGHDQQHSGPLDMPEELVSETLSLRRALDQSGNICDHHLEAVCASSGAVVEPDDSEAGLRIPR